MGLEYSQQWLERRINERQPVLLLQCSRGGSAILTADLSLHVDHTCFPKIDFRSSWSFKGMLVLAKFFFSIFQDWFFFSINANRQNMSWCNPVLIVSIVYFGSVLSISDAWHSTSRDKNCSRTCNRKHRDKKVPNTISTLRFRTKLRHFWDGNRYRSFFLFILEFSEREIYLYRKQVRPDLKPPLLWYDTL